MRHLKFLVGIHHPLNRSHCYRYSQWSRSLFSPVSWKKTGQSCSWAAWTHDADRTQNDCNRTCTGLGTWGFCRDFHITPRSVFTSLSRMVRGRSMISAASARTRSYSSKFNANSPARIAYHMHGEECACDDGASALEKRRSKLPLAFSQAVCRLKLCVTTTDGEARRTITESIIQRSSGIIPYYQKEDARNAPWVLHFYQRTFVWNLSFDGNMTFRRDRMWLYTWIWHVYCDNYVCICLTPSIRWTVMPSLHVLSMYHPKKKEQQFSAQNEVFLRVYPWENIGLSLVFSAKMRLKEFFWTQIPRACVCFEDSESELKTHDPVTYELSPFPLRSVRSMKHRSLKIILFSISKRIK